MNKIYTISLLLFLLISMNLKPVSAIQYTVFLDPGHGGIDGGASSGNTIEKNINLKIALMLQKILIEDGYKVHLTRDGDYDLATNPNARKRTDLANRVKMINDSACDMFISIHLNTFSQASYRGSQVFYQKMNVNNELIANLMQQSLRMVLKNTNRSTKRIGNIYLLDNVRRPGVLVECGFLSNPQELILLQSEAYLSKIAYALSRGINSYFFID